MKFKDIKKKLKLTSEMEEVLSKGNIIFPESREQLFSLAMGNSNTKDFFEVHYTIPGIGKVVECTVAKCKNGVAVNYTDKYMRRRDPNCMVIADERESDKERFSERFGESFDGLRADTLRWFKELDSIIAVPFMSGGKKWGYPSILLVPANAAFFAAVLADIQGFIPLDKIADNFEPRGIMYIAPPFRHTYFKGKQVVVHNRTEKFHEVFSYNLYPGPSAKKGVYSILLDFAEKEGWNILHASTVKVTTPYDNTYNIMHEGASGGGKSEMLELIQREQDGRILLGSSVVNEDKIYTDLIENSNLVPVTDDMALAPKKLQKTDKVTVSDAEAGWFIRVDNIKDYGSDPELEHLTINPPGPMIFLNIDAAPNSTALIWEHIQDSPGKSCSNPRFVLPRHYFGAFKDDEVAVDLRSFGFRTPPTTYDKPGYAVVGVFHVLPPAIAWIWRLVAPRGYANPSVFGDSKVLESEGVGSYWPFATGKRVTQANILLEQIVNSPGTRYVLIPNQHIGSYTVGFKAEWLSREYLARRGQSRFRSTELRDFGSPVLGYGLKRFKLDGKELPTRLLNVAEQKYVGKEGFNLGVKILTDFFKEELKKFQTEGLNPLGEKIIDAFLRDASLEEFNMLIEPKYIKFE